MTRISLFAAAVVFGGVWAAQPAGAAQPEELSLEERVKRIEEMLGIGALAAEIPNAPPVRQAALAPAAIPQPAAPSAAAQPAPESTPVWSYTNNRPTIRSQGEDFSLALRGRFQFDSGMFYQDSNLAPSVVAGRDLRNGTHFRRAQIGIEGTVFTDFDYEFVFDFGSSATERAGQIYLMRLAYTGVPNFTFNVGAIQPKFTLDDSTSSADLTFMERSSIVNTILDPFGGSDSRRGAELRYQREGVFNRNDNLLVATALTGERIADAKSDDEGSQIVGRVAYRIHSDARSNFQIGANAARILNQADAMISFADRPEIRIDGRRLVGFGASGLTPAIGAKSATLWGLEGAMNYGPFTMQGEYFRYNVERTDPALKDPTFGGWYLQASYILTGQTRPYLPASAAFGSPVAQDPFDLGTNDWGVWEIKGRYSVNDLNDYVFDANPANWARGGRQRVIGTGINWYMNRNVRWLFDYNIVDINRLDAVGLEAGQDFQILAARMQFSF